MKPRGSMGVDSLPCIPGACPSACCSRGCGRRWRKRGRGHWRLWRLGQWRLRRGRKRGLCPGLPHDLTVARVCGMTNHHQSSLSLRDGANVSVRDHPPSLRLREVSQRRGRGCRARDLPPGDAGVPARPAGSARRACPGKTRPPQWRPSFPSDVLEVPGQQIPDHLVSNVGGHPKAGELLPFKME